MSKRRIKVIVVNVGEQPTEMLISNELKAYQGLVDGYIEELRPWDDNVSLIVNEDRFRNNLKPNRKVAYDCEGDVSVLLYGTIVVVESGKTDFKSLSKEQVAKYIEIFKL